MTKRETDNSPLDEVVPKKHKGGAPSANLLGLTEFINHGFTPITGELKSRVEDFIVTEISLDGVPCILESFGIPQRQKSDRNPDTLLVDLSEEITRGLNQVLDGSVPDYKFPAPVDKGDRTALHKSIGSFNDKLSSETVKDGDDSVIRVSLKKKSFHNNRDRHLNKDEQNLHFTLLKWNITTADAVLKLSKILQTKPGNFSYGGQKDKRGITSQRMCWKFGEPKRLAGINKPFFEANEIKTEPLVYRNNFLIGDYSFHRDDFRLGDLAGNSFTIVLRECKPTTEENLAVIRSLLMENGFINYFGLQRFGNERNTQEIGKFILNKDYRGAITTILTANSHHKADEVKALCHYKETGDAKEALGMLKYKSCTEGLLLKSLSVRPTDFKRALKTLHHKQQTLYTHAYQSFVWNKLVSKRIQCHGTQVLEGDLVRHGADNTVRKIEADEVAGAQFSDIVLPLPGYDVVLPDNPCRGYLTDILSEDNMSLANFSGSTGKEFNVSGCYRNVIFKPSEFTTEMFRYSDENEKLVKTNLDVISGKEFERTSTGDKLAICLRFTLPKSCYATMLLREISRAEIG